MKVGDIYPTRDGRKAKVTKIDGSYTTIEIFRESPEIRMVWTENGRGNCSITYPYDLILPPKTNG